MKTAFAVAVLGLVALCASAQDVPTTQAQNAPATEPVVDPLETLAKAIERAAAKRDAREYALYFDFDALFRNATTGINLTSATVNRVRRGFDDGAAGFVQTVMKSLEPGGDYRFMKIIRTDGGSRLLFRVSGAQGLNYHQLFIAPNALGDLRIVDIDIMASGETLSQTLQRILEQAMFQAGRSKDVQPSQAELAEGIVKMAQLIRQEKGNDALDVYDALSETTRQIRIVQLVRLQAALLVGEQDYALAREQYRSLFKDDPTADLFLLGDFMLRKHYDLAETAIDHLDRWVGGDPILDVSRSNVALARGDAEKAKSLATEAARREPQLVSANEQLLVIALRQKDYSETLRLMRVLRDDFKMEFGDLPGIPEFADFIKSREYREWLRVRPQQTPPATSRPAFRF